MLHLLNLADREWQRRFLEEQERERNEEMSMKRVAIKCKYCGSKDVVRDAYAEWDEQRQMWVLCSVFDEAYCSACGDETSLTEEVL